MCSEAETRRRTRTSAIVAIDPYTGRTTRVGQLPVPLSDAAAISLSDSAWLAGGLSASGESVATVLELMPTES